MRYEKVLIFLFITLLFSGCIENVTDRFSKVQVVQVKVNVTEMDNITTIQTIEAKGEEIMKLSAPGMVFPEKFPAIYAEILQPYQNTSTLNGISFPNGQEYKGPGNYSFTVQLSKDSLNKSRPLVAYVEVMNQTARLARNSIAFNWTE